MTPIRFARALSCAALAASVCFGCGSGTTTTVLSAGPTTGFALVSNNIGGVFVYKWNLTSGALAIGNAHFGQGLSYDVVVDPSSKFVYSADCMIHSATAFSLDFVTGTLLPQTGVSVFAGNCPLALAVHPSGKFLYVLASGFVVGTEPTNPGSLTTFTIDSSTGQLSALAGGGFSFGIGDSTGRLALDAAGKFLYATDGRAVFSFAVDQSTGLLTSVAGSPFAAGNSPFGVAVDSSAGLLFVANASSGDLSTFSINSAGILTELSRTLVGKTPWTVILDPTSRFLYITDHDANAVLGFAVNDVARNLTPVAGSPFATGTGPNHVAIDPSGKFLYVSNEISNDISAFAIDSGTGSLTPIASSPFPQTGVPGGIAFAVH